MLINFSGPAVKIAHQIQCLCYYLNWFIHFMKCFYHRSYDIGISHSDLHATILRVTDDNPLFTNYSHFCGLDYAYKLIYM